MLTKLHHQCGSEAVVFVNVHGSWIYNYLCSQCLSPLTLRVGTPLTRGVIDTTLLNFLLIDIFFSLNYIGLGFGLWCLTSLSTIFQLYRGGQFLLMDETEVPGEDHQPAASRLSPLTLRVGTPLTRGVIDTTLCDIVCH
jgi:hypothetical protein